VTALAERADRPALIPSMTWGCCVAAQLNSAIRAAIAAIPGDAWTAIEYPQAIEDEQLWHRFNRELADLTRHAHS